jgi:hypothetical protein
LEEKWKMHTAVKNGGGKWRKRAKTNEQNNKQIKPFIL